MSVVGFRQTDGWMDKVAVGALGFDLCDIYTELEYHGKCQDAASVRYTHVRIYIRIDRYCSVYAAELCPKKILPVDELLSFRMMVWSTSAVI